jgi:alkaline phosphatase
MVEAGDVDWANHSNNIDNSIGAVISGDNAFHAVTGWVEKHGGWNDTVLILTADHGHYLVLNRPEMLLPPGQRDENFAEKQAD